MKLVYAPSYQSINFLVQFFELQNVGVITRNSKIKEFCEHLGMTCFYSAYYDSSRFKDHVRHRKELVEFSKQFEDDEIIFCFYSYAIVDLFLIECLSKQNKILFINRDPVCTKVGILGEFFKSKAFRWRCIDVLKYFLIYRIRFEIFVEYERYFFGIDPKQLASKYEEFKPEENSNRIADRNSQAIQKAFKGVVYDIVYIDNLGQDWPKDAERVAIVLNALLAAGYSVGIKPHPINLMDDAFKGYETLDKRIPAEMLAPFVSKCVLGISSASLNSLATHVRVMTLLNFVELVSPEMCEYLRSCFLSDQVKKLDSVDDLLKELGESA